MKLHDFVEAITLTKKEDMKDILKKEDVKERMTNRAFELFSEGVPNEEIQKELSVIVPNVSIDIIQRLHRQWDDKKAADGEMTGEDEGTVGGSEREAVQVGETPSSEREIKPSVMPRVELEKKVEGKETFLPSQKEFVDYLKPRTLGYEEILDKVFSKTRWRHWVRHDESGFSLPSAEDWIELKKVLNLDDTFDLSQTEQLGVFDESKPTGDGMEEKIMEGKIEKKPGEEMPYEEAADAFEKERRELERMKAEVRDDKAHVEIVRATEELRRAITSEIHAQESYEDAKREMESAKEEMIRVRSELDKFRQSVDMLKLEERLQKREPVEEADLEVETIRGREFEKKVSMRGVERIVEDMIEDAFRKRDVVKEKPPGEEKKETVETEKEKLEEGTPEISEGKNGRVDDIVKDLYKKNIISIEGLAVYLDISIEEARKLDIKRDEEVLQSTEDKKPAEEITIPPKDALVKVAELAGTSVEEVRKWITEKHIHPKVEAFEPVDEKPLEEKVEERTTAQKFYDKVKRYLEIHPYLIVKKELGVPEVYYMRLKRDGILIGLGGGVPAGCLLLYIILLLAGVV